MELLLSDGIRERIMENKLLPKGFKMAKMPDIKVLPMSNLTDILHAQKQDQLETQNYG